MQSNRPTKIVNVYAGKGPPERYLYEILMLDPSGFVMPVTTQTSPDVHPTESDYGRAIVSEKRAQGWLFWNSCPAGTGAVADTDACPAGSAMPCPHLLRHRACRVKDHEDQSRENAEKVLSSAEKQLRAQEAARVDSAAAISAAERRHEELMAQNVALMAQLAGAMQTLADNSKPRKAKPGDE